MSKCKTCFADILNSDWPIGPGYFVSAKDFEELRKAVKEAEPPHEHYEGMNECPYCDQPFLLSAAKLVSQQHREVEALRAKLDMALTRLSIANGFCGGGENGDCECYTCWARKESAALAGKGAKP